MKLKFEEIKYIDQVIQLATSKCWSQEAICLSDSRVNTPNSYPKLKKMTVQEINYQYKPQQKQVL